MWRGRGAGSGVDVVQGVARTRQPLVLDNKAFLRRWEVARDVGMPSAVEVLRVSDFGACCERMRK